MTEAFEDVEHSDEAKELLLDLEVAKLKRVAGDPPVKAELQSGFRERFVVQKSPMFGFGAMCVLLLCSAVAYHSYIRI